MKNKKAFALLCVMVIMLGGLAFRSLTTTRGQTVAKQKQPDRTTPIPATGGTKQSPHPSQAPEHVIYREFFHHFVALKQRAAEEEGKGKSGKALREHYKKQIGLKDKDADLLDQIADECERETAKVDAKAQKIIDAARKKIPNGKVPSSDELPPPPPELKKLQLKRDMIVMRARHRLVTEMGVEGFQQIDDFLKLNFAKNVQPAAVVPKQPGNNQKSPSSGGNQ
jgi:hypothetical protein